MIDGIEICRWIKYCMNWNNQDIINKTINMLKSSHSIFGFLIIMFESECIRYT